MNLITNIYFFLAVLFFLSACQKNTNSGVITGSGIILDSSVTEQQSELIKKDLDILLLANFNSFEQNDLSYFNIENFNNITLLSWLTNRVKYIVGENYNYQERAYIHKVLNYKPEIFTDMIKKTDFVTVMSNLGSGLYLWGKQNSFLIGIEVAGKEFLIKSPRAGIIQIGEGLFTVYKAYNSDIDSVANSFLRLSVFFHEARHSDGNGENAAFGHKICPEWHDYYGYYACDKNLNGPYTIGAIMLKNAQKSCTECTNSEVQTLKLFQADSEYRILPDSKIEDYRPERIR
jgi:hypothetical protein